MGDEVRFSASEHIIKLKGKDYLEVKWRLVWLRDEHPDASIATEVVRWDAKEAIFKATVSIPGGGSATGYGSEVPGDFADYGEKAETKAIGRALAALGFGTQFCEDHTFDPEQAGRVVDAPVQRRPDPAPSAPSYSPPQDGAPRTVSQPDAPASDAQKRFLFRLASDALGGPDQYRAWVGGREGEAILTKGQANKAINYLQLMKADAATPDLKGSIGDWLASEAEAEADIPF